MVARLVSNHSTFVDGLKPVLEKLSKSELFNTIIPGRLYATRTSHGKILELRVCGPAGTGRASESAIAGKFGNHKSRGELNGLERSKDRDTKYDYTKRIDSQTSSGFQDARSKQRFSTTSRSSSDSCNETNEHISQPENKLGHLDRRKNIAEVANSQSTTNTSSCKNNSQKVLARSGSQIQEVFFISATRPVNLNSTTQPGVSDQDLNTCPSSLFGQQLRHLLKGVSCTVTVYPSVNNDDAMSENDNETEDDVFEKLNRTRKLGGKSSCKKNEKGFGYSSNLEAKLKRDFDWW